MRVVKTYETFIGEFDADFAMAKIKHFYSDFKIKEMFDEELPNWVDENEVGDKYEDVCDWFYDSHSEDSKNPDIISKKRQIAFATSELVVEQLIDWYEEEFSQDLTDEQREELSKRIIETYEGINPENW
jgi:hypothetical protein